MCMTHEEIHYGKYTYISSLSVNQFTKKAFLIKTFLQCKTSVVDYEM